MLTETCDTCHRKFSIVDIRDGRCTFCSVVLVKLSYFNRAGKLYCDGELEFRGRPYELPEHVRGLMRNKKLPGLIPDHSPFMVLVQNQILIPEEWGWSV
jgi:hypothetical protein